MTPDAVPTVTVTVAVAVELPDPVRPAVITSARMGTTASNRIAATTSFGCVQCRDRGPPETAWTVIQGIEAAQMIGKGQGALRVQHSCSLTSICLPSLEMQHFSTCAQQVIRALVVADMRCGWLLHPVSVRLLRAIVHDSATARILTNCAPRITGLFDRGWYAAAYPDVRDGGWDPLVHYMAFGAAEGRNPHPLFDAAYYVREHPEARSNPLVHYAMEGAGRRYSTHPDRGFCLIPPLARPLRILTLLVRYGTDKYPGADERLEALMSRAFLGAIRRTIIIDNALPATIERRLAPDRMLIGGDNTSWEFSGWDCGLRSAASELENFDFIHFATDAFEQFDADFPARVDVRVLEALRFGRALAGHIDYYNEPATLFGHTVQSWIRSSFFFVRPDVVKALGSMVSVHGKSVLFTGDPAQPFRADSPVSEKLASYLASWLTGPGLGQGVEWHSRFELNERTLPLFEAKSVAIMNELMLSERLRSLGCWMADATWTRGVIDGAVRGRLFEEPWCNQVANRPA